MQFKVEIDQAAPQAWSEWLDRFEDGNIYQTRAYGVMRWGEPNLSHLVLKAGSDVVAMAQLRILRPANLNCGMAYLRWGPLCHIRGRQLEPAVAEAIASSLYEEYVKKRRLLLRILPNAFAGSTRAAVFQCAFNKFASETFEPGASCQTSVLDLSIGLEQVRKKLDQKWRNQLNRAERNELKIREGSFEEFRKLYDEMWARKRFQRSSSVAEFARMQELLPINHRMVVYICEDKGVAVAGFVGTAMGNTGIYLFGATSDAGMKSKGAYLLQWHMINRLHEKGIRYYNLGGINAQTNPGVYHFKQGMSGEEVFYMPPLSACDAFLSRTLVRGAEFYRQSVRGALKRLIRA